MFMTKYILTKWMIQISHHGGDGDNDEHDDDDASTCERIDMNGDNS